MDEFLNAEVEEAVNIDARKTYQKDRGTTATVDESPKMLTIAELHAKLSKLPGPATNKPKPAHNSGFRFGTKASNRSTGSEAQGPGRFMKSETSRSSRDLGSEVKTSPRSNISRPQQMTKIEEEAKNSEKIVEEPIEAGNQLNHLAFEDKPVIASSRKAAQQKKTNAFFSDSDEDETHDIEQKKSSPYCGRP